MKMLRNMNRRNLCIAAAISLVAIVLVAGNVNATSIKSQQPKKADPYTQQYCDLSTAEDFNLGNGRTYYSELKPGEENILLFWGSFCPHCENVFNYIGQSDCKQTIERNLFTILEDDEIGDIEQHKGEFPILLDSNWKTFDQFNLEHLPSALVIDDAGNILGSAEGEHDVKALLDEYVCRNN